MIAGETVRVENVVADEGETVSLAWDSDDGTESVVLTERTLTADHQGVDDSPAGTVDILDSNIQPSDSDFDVETSNYENTSTAYLVVSKNNTGDESVHPDTGETIVTVDTADVNPSDGDKIQAKLFASSDRNLLLDIDNETVTSGGGGGGGGPGFTFPVVGLALLVATLLGSREETDGGETNG